MGVQSRLVGVMSVVGGVQVEFFNSLAPGNATVILNW